MIDTTTTVDMKQHVFEKLKVGSSFAIGRNTLEALTIEQAEDLTAQNIVISLLSFVLAERICEDYYDVPFTHSWEEPSSWWQMFKQEVMPKWFTDKFPVQMDKLEITRTNRINITRKATYPRASLTKFGGQLERELGKPVIIDEVEIK